MSKEELVNLVKAQESRIFELEKKGEAQEETYKRQIEEFRIKFLEHESAEQKGALDSGLREQELIDKIKLLENSVRSGQKQVDELQSGGGSLSVAASPNGVLSSRSESGQDPAVDGMLLSADSGSPEEVAKVLSFVLNIKESDYGLFPTCVKLLTIWGENQRVVLGLGSRLEKITYQNSKVRNHLLNSGCLETALQIISRISTTPASPLGSDSESLAGAELSTSQAETFLLLPLLGLLWNLSMEEEGVHRLTGGLRTYLDILLSGARAAIHKVEVHHAAISIVSNLAMVEGNRLGIIESGFVVYLDEVIKAQSGETTNFNNTVGSEGKNPQDPAHNNLAQTATDVQSFNELIESGLQTLYMLCYPNELRDTIVRQGGKDLLAYGMNSTSTECKRWAMWIETVLK